MAGLIGSLPRLQAVGIPDFFDYVCVWLEESMEKGKNFLSTRHLHQALLLIYAY